MKINPNLTAIGNLFALINSANPDKNFTPAQVIVSSVTPREPGSIPYNSSAVLTGTPNGPYKNSQTVYYNRRSVTEAVDTPTVSYAVDTTTTLDDLLSMVCFALKIIKSDVELVDFKTAPDATVSTMTLQPITNALLYVDTFDITLIWSGDALASVATLWAGDKLDELINVTMPSRGYV